MKLFDENQVPGSLDSWLPGRRIREKS